MALTELNGAKVEVRDGNTVIELCTLIVPGPDKQNPIFERVEIKPYITRSNGNSIRFNDAILKGGELDPLPIYKNPGNFPQLQNLRFFLVETP